MIAIIDYGMGNLRSVQKAFEKMGAQTLITQKVQDLDKAEKIVLPGVGAIKPAVEKLSSLGLIETIKNKIKAGVPFLGICLGFQLLFDKSDEGGNVTGLGIIKGSVRKFKPSASHQLKIPHMGWNRLKLEQENCDLFSNIDNNSYAYFCHSYYVEPQDKSIIATKTEYADTFASSIATNNIFGVQFHPEKSQSIGLKILKNFMEFNKP